MERLCPIYGIRVSHTWENYLPQVAKRVVTRGKYNKNQNFYFTYSARSVRRMSPLRRKVSCMAKAALRQW